MTLPVLVYYCECGYTVVQTLKIRDFVQETRYSLGETLQMPRPYCASGTHRDRPTPPQMMLAHTGFLETAEGRGS